MNCQVAAALQSGYGIAGIDTPAEVAAGRGICLPQLCSAQSERGDRSMNLREIVWLVEDHELQQTSNLIVQRAIAITRRNDDGKIRL
jgi:hypothetical protein